MILSAWVCMGKEELKEEKEQGGAMTGAPAAQGQVNRVFHNTHTNSPLLLSVLAPTSK